MSRNPRYDILFEPVRIGPVTAPNRFYQTPHALGTGNAMPHTRAAMREVRAEGGWGVVNTGYCSIHPSSDDAPLPYCRLWDDEDIPVHALMVDAVHRHGALAGVELWHGGSDPGNRFTRVTPMSASGVPAHRTYPGWMSLSTPRPMDSQDIRELRGWYVDAARRARSAGFDIIYVYAGMGYAPYEFLLPALNKRTDAYGGSIENRARLLREILEDMKEAVGGTCAVAVRFSSDALLDVPGKDLPSEAHEIVSLLAEVPDLWDVKSADWTVETASARFSEEGAQEPLISFVKPLTTKPVVGVGRFTSPDEMVRQVRRGVLDLIGAARPSIADPFLPRKIDEGREDEIRECIGCKHLRVLLPRRRSRALHAEPDDGRGVAARLAPGTHPARRSGNKRVGRRRGAGRTRMRTGIGATRLQGHAGRGARGTRRSRHNRSDATRPCRLGRGSGTTGRT